MWRSGGGDGGEGEEEERYKLIYGFEFQLGLGWFFGDCGVNAEASREQGHVARHTRQFVGHLHLYRSSPATHLYSSVH